MGVVTVERLERALALVAYLVVLDGSVMIPMFERLERELAAMRRSEDAVGRAKRLLETYRPEQPAALMIEAKPLSAA